MEGEPGDVGKIREVDCKGPLNPPKGEVYISEIKNAFLFLCALAPWWQKTIREFVVNKK
jgi:hypothetical protein